MAANRSKVVYIIHVYVMVTQSHCMFFTNLLLYWLFQIDTENCSCVKANLQIRSSSRQQKALSRRLFTQIYFIILVYKQFSS